MTGVGWEKAAQAWQAKWQESGIKHQKKKVFDPRRFLTEGMDYEDAVQAAMRAAVAHREKMVASGNIKVSIPTSVSNLSSFKNRTT